MVAALAAPPRAKEPQAFFVLGGDGIRLPLKEWPFDYEYQLLFWVRLDRLPRRGTTATLVSLQAADGGGVAVVVHPTGSLELSVGDSGVIAKGGRPVPCRCGALERGKWHHVNVIPTPLQHPAPAPPVSPSVCESVSPSARQPVVTSTLEAGADS